jgi:hypothetical protein
MTIARIGWAPSLRRACSATPEGGKSCSASSSCFATRARRSASPARWPAIFGALVLAVVVFALSRAHVWTWVLGGALALLVATESLHVLGLWGATTTTGLTKLAASAYSLGGIVVGIGALAWLARRGGVAASPAVLVAAVFLTVSGGLGDITVLTRSQVPSTLPDWMARLEVVVALGLGVGLLAASALRLRAPTPAPSGGREPHDVAVTS